MTHTALLIIDIQNDYFQDGKMPLHKAEAAADKAAQILDFFRKKQMPVFHIQHESVGKGATFFIPGTTGQKINERVNPIETEPLIVKQAPNAFLNTGLEQKLTELGIKKVVIVGMMTFMCVDATARAAKDLGFHCTLLHDATAARALSFDGQSVTADQVKTSFSAALSMICDSVTTCDAFLKDIERKE